MINVIFVLCPVLQVYLLNILFKIYKISVHVLEDQYLHCITCMNQHFIISIFQYRERGFIGVVVCHTFYLKVLDLISSGTEVCPLNTLLTIEMVDTQEAVRPCDFIQM